MSGRRGKRHIPTPKGQVVTPHPKGILELDRFTEASITKWNELSADLDELQDVLHFNLEPERRRLRGELISALQQVEPKTYFSITGSELLSIAGLCNHCQQQVVSHILVVDLTRGMS